MKRRNVIIMGTLYKEYYCLVVDLVYMFGRLYIEQVNVTGE